MMPCLSTLSCTPNKASYEEILKYIKMIFLNDVFAQGQPLHSTLTPLDQTWLRALLKGQTMAAQQSLDLNK